MKKAALFLIFVFTLCNVSYCQIGSIFKFGTVVYYKIDSLSCENLKGASVLFDNKIEGRYFDLHLKGNSIKVLLTDTSYFFNQKKRPEPSDYQKIVFYKNRYLIYDNLIIKSLKIKNIDQEFILAEAKIISKESSSKRKTKEEILLSRNDVEGIFLGYGKDSRSIVYGGGILGGILATILILI